MLAVIGFVNEVSAGSLLLALIYDRPNALMIIGIHELLNLLNKTESWSKAASNQVGEN